MAKASFSVGAKAASHAVGNIFANEDEKADRFKSLLMSQMKGLTRELGQLKGSLMKVGQLLSMYGEHFLPPEANAFLKSLQSQSPPLEWKAIERVLKKQLTAEKLALLEIDPEPIASASLGQVHRARVKADGRWVAIKVQYPGVDQAIEGDLKALKSLLMVSKLLPSGPKFDHLFEEVRSMLKQEVDYRLEMKMTQFFKNALKEDPRYIVPEVLPEFSTKRVLTTTFEEGFPVDSPQVLGLPKERRDALASAYLSLYFRELFDLNAVQTDPHFGNYRVRLGAQPGEADRLVLFDFGAVRKLEDPFKASYLRLVRGTFHRDFAEVIAAATGLGFLLPSDSQEQKQLFFDLCQLITEGFYTPSEAPEVPKELFDSNGNYLWSRSDLPKRAANKGAKLAFLMKLRTPPHEIVFLDRKLGGIFIFLSVLDASFSARKLMSPYIDNSRTTL